MFRSSLQLPSLFLLLLSLRLSTSLSFLNALRTISPADISGVWTLVWSPDRTQCANTIQHLDYNRIKEGPFRIAHKDIIQDGQQCIDPTSAPRQRVFRLYPSAAVRRKIAVPEGSFRIPHRLLQVLQTTGPAKKTRQAAEKFGETYYIGFEAVERECNDSAVFQRGTTAFLLRPLKKSMKIPTFEVDLTVGKRWLVMVPFRRKGCVYEWTGSEASKPSPGANDTGEGEGSDGDGDKPTNGNDLEGSGSDRRACFPGEATVNVEGRGEVKMRDVKVGYSVEVGNGVFSKVFMFTHQDESAREEFVLVETGCGERLMMSGGHYIYVNGNLETGFSVKVGDHVVVRGGRECAVTRVGREIGKGLYNPQTLHGDIMVNGIKTSTYTMAVVAPMAHGLLSPLRGAFRLVGREFCCGGCGKGGRWWDGW